MIPGQAQQFFEAAAAQAGASGFEIVRSLRFNSADSAYLNRTPSSASNRSTWTWSGWLKRSGLGVRQHIFNAGSNATSTDHTYIDFWADDTLNLQSYSSNANIWNLKTTQVFRDPSAWYHIVWVFDTTQSTASNRVKLYINGSQITDFSVTTYPSQNYEGGINAAAPHAIGKYAADFGPDHFNGYLAEVYFIDGQALAATDFGETDSNNNWNPKEYIFDTPKWVGDWASDTTGTPYSAGTSAANAFDGNSSTQAAPTTSSSMVFTPSSPITGITKVRIRAQYDSGSSADILLNGSSIKSSWSSGENAKKEFTVNNLTSLEWQTDGSNLWISVRSIEIEVDGVYHYLVLGGVNDFYLKFADNSSDAALGTDSSGNNNTWTVNNFNVGAVTYSADANYTTDGNYLLDKTAPFNGTTPNAVINESTGAITNSNSRGVWANTARTYIRWDAPTAIPITSGVDFYGGAYNDAAEVATLEIYYTDGTSSSGTFTSSSQSYMGRVTGVTSGKSLDYVQVSCANACFTAIRVNGSFLDDLPASFNDSLIDTPTNYEANSGNNGGNYATLNPLDTIVSLTNGNLETNTSSGWQSTRATFGVSSGKWYWETQNKQTAAAILGISGSSAPMTSGLIFGSDANPAWTWAGANRYFNGSSAGTGLSNHSATDIVMYALDVDAGKLWFGRNGTWYDSSWGSTGNPATGANATVSGLSTTETWRPAASFFSGAAIFNFGARSFSYSAPSGFKALCTTNLPTPTIADGSTAMDVKLWTGNGSSQSISTSFSPDFVWVKERGGTGWHNLYDTVRGVKKGLITNDTRAEATYNDGVTAFGTDSFTVSHDGANTIHTNSNNDTYVAWTWDAGTSTVSNTDGSITSSVRANASAGFSIVTATLPNYYTNYTIGHGLNATPHFIIGKNRASANQWDVYHKDVGAGKLLRLNQTNAVENATANQDSYYPTAPTNSVFGFVGNNATMNFVWYVFTEVANYSAFGSYTGNGSDDGPFVFTGFRVAWLLIKNTSTNGEAWTIYDSTRDVDNTAKQRLLPNSSDAESVGSSARFKDLLSNGFKIRGTSGEQNTSGDVYIYAAFAEHPFKTARGR